MLRAPFCSFFKFLVTALYALLFGVHWSQYEYESVYVCYCFYIWNSTLFANAKAPVFCCYHRHVSLEGELQQQQRLPQWVHKVPIYTLLSWGFLLLLWLLLICMLCLCCSPLCVVFDYCGIVISVAAGFCCCSCYCDISASICWVVSARDVFGRFFASLRVSWVLTTVIITSLNVELSARFVNVNALEKLAKKLALVRNKQLVNKRNFRR